MSGSESEEENVIKYGTPLEPYEEDEIPSKRKFQQPSDQYAVDAHGRRRFHGAFTGGFSAGYGNSVGTPEGWTPASFKSSRSEKAEISNQKPEDYMDDEDRGEFGIAPQRLQTHDEFSGRKRQRQRYHDGPIPGEPVLEQLIRAVHETAAVKMLRKMGWRDGQGVGSRLRKDEKRRAREEHKVYGCYMPPEMRQESQAHSEDDSSDSEFDYDTLFAPDDYEPYILKRKNDQFGLGYSGLSRHSVLGNLTGEYGSDSGPSKSHLLMKEKGKKVSIRGQAFGVGTFEADDEDIYATEDMSHYDFAIGEAEKSTQKKTTQTSSKVLQGFVKASKPLPSVPKYPPPALPRDYVPAAAGARRTRFEPSTEPQRDQGLGRHELTAEARGALLGETPLQKSNDEDLQTNTIKTNKIAKSPIKIINFVSTNKKTESDFIPLSTSDFVPKVFKPFINDPAKQARYEAYLKDKNAWDRDSNIQEMSEWERNREILEFEQSAKLYRPLTGVMSDRFTHASQPDDAVNPLSAVAKSSTNYGLATPEQIEAAKNGVYGVMTRMETQWRPEALVCKRFNVPELGGGRPDSTKQDKPKVSYSIFSYLETSVHDKESFTKEQSKFSGSKSSTVQTGTKQLDTNQQHKTKETVDKIKTKENVDKVTTTNIKVHKPENEPIVANKRMTVAELFLKESEKDLKNTEKVEETIEKFDKMDLYKSIFLSDSEPEVEEVNENKTDSFVEKPKNTERNLSPTRGIFANIDFDELNSWKRNDKRNETKDDKIKDNEKVINNDSVKNKDANAIEDNAIYGPKIPENLKQKITASTSDVNFKPVFREKSRNDESSSSDSWIDVNEVKSKKQKKKKVKKHKSKHKKAKHKKKDK